MKRSERLGKARPILHYLNEKTGRKFSETETNLTPIAARLEEVDWDAAGVRIMIDRQIKRWHGTRFEEYLRPTTLFGRQKFDGYYAARDLPINHAEDNAETGHHGAGRTEGPSPLELRPLNALRAFHARLEREEREGR